MEVSGQLHGQAALPQRKEPPLPIGEGGWMGPRAGLEAVAKRKITSLALPEIDSQSSSL